MFRLFKKTVNKELTDINKLEDHCDTDGIIIDDAFYSNRTSRINSSLNTVVDTSIIPNKNKKIKKKTY